MEDEKEKVRKVTKVISVKIGGVNIEGHLVEFGFSTDQDGAKFTDVYKNLLVAVKRDGISPNTLPDAASKQQPPATKKFIADTLSATMKDGKTYWKVKGGPFRVHGVSLWPEVAKAAGIPVKGKDKEMEINLDPRTIYDLNVSVEVSMKQSPSDETKTIPQKVVWMADVKHLFGEAK